MLTMVIPGKLSLKTLAVIASVEAKAESKSFFNRIPQFLEQLREKVASDITMTKGESPSEQLNPKAFTKMLKDVNYATISELAVFRPTGMRGGYQDYVEMLAEFQEQIGGIEERLLTPLKRTVAQMLVEPKRLSQAFPVNYKVVDIEKLQKLFNKEVDLQDSGDKIAYSDAVNRNKDWEGIVSTVNLLDDQYQREPNSDILKSVGELTEHINLLIQRISDQLDVYVVKGTTLSALVDATYQAAKEVELYAAHGFNLATTKKALVDSYRQVKEAIE